MSNGVFLFFQLMRGLVLLLVCGCLSVVHAAELPSHVAALAFLEDPSGELDLDQVRSSDLTPFSGILSRGYTASVHWIRVGVVPGEGAASDELLVRIRPAYLDEIKLYDPELQSDVVGVTGDQYPLSGDAYPSLYFNLAIVRGAAPRDIWLRLKSASTSQIHVDILERNDAIWRDRRHELLFMFYLAALLLFFGWGLVNWLAERERLMGVFVLKQAVSVLYSLAYLGYLRLLVPETIAVWLKPDTLTSVLVITMVGAAYLFDYSFLKEFRAPRFLTGILRVVPVISPLLVLLLLFGHVREALAFNNLLVVFLPLLTFVTALLLPATAARSESDKLLLPKSHVVTLYLLVLVSVLLSTLPATGMFKGSEWTFSGYLMYSLCTGAFVLVMLQIRALRLRQQRAQLAVALQAAEQRAEIEGSRRREQGSFLAMLAHELNTPLSVVKMTLSAPRQTPSMLTGAQMAASSMEDIIQRCLQVNRLEDARIAPRHEPCVIADVLVDLVNGNSAAQRIELEISELTTIHTDVILLRMIIGNLIDNALKYGDAQAPVRAVAGMSEQDGVSGVAVEVSNAPGKAGWPDPDQVFKKFYRDPRARNASGSGLGLFLVDGLSRLLDGRVDYLSPTETEEIRFRLWIPVR